MKRTLRTFTQSRPVFILICSFLLSTFSSAEQKEDFGDYEVHYNAFQSTFLTPEVAKQYGLKRSKSVAVVNIAVLKKQGQGKLPVTVGAGLEGTVTNDVQQQRSLAFQRVNEGTAVYYIAQFQYVQNELLTFHVTAYPDGSNQPLKIRFAQNFYND